jgi:hypothetical protein
MDAEGIVGVLPGIASKEQRFLDLNSLMRLCKLRERDRLRLMRYRLPGSVGDGRTGGIYWVQIHSSRASILEYLV